MLQRRAKGKQLSLCVQWLPFIIEIYSNSRNDHPALGDLEPRQESVCVSKALPASHLLLLNPPPTTLRAAGKTLFCLAIHVPISVGMNSIPAFQFPSLPPHKTRKMTL